MLQKRYVKCKLTKFYTNKNKQKLWILHPKDIYGLHQEIHNFTYIYGVLLMYLMYSKCNCIFTLTESDLSTILFCSVYNFWVQIFNINLCDSQMIGTLLSEVQHPVLSFVLVSNSNQKRAACLISKIGWLPWVKSDPML